ncbi:hypothetical protein [Mesorhizobium sp. CA8]|uniref:hypothetical protein n=1 Tax=Mesorhizobium sp. CA8 TaxID=2876637 RepID=UPI001CCEBE0B|nr:hypothetical protein [Mesorhizobium sp. CA8]
MPTKNVDALFGRSSADRRCEFGFHVRRDRTSRASQRGEIDAEQVAAKNEEMSKNRSEEVKSKTASVAAQWSSYPQDKLESPVKPDTSQV